MIPVPVHIVMIYKITREIGHSISPVKIVWGQGLTHFVKCLWNTHGPRDEYKNKFRTTFVTYTLWTFYERDTRSSGKAICVKKKSGTRRNIEMKVRIFSRRSHEGMLNINSLAWNDNIFNSCLNKKSYNALIDRHKRLNYWNFVISKTCDKCFVNIVVENVTVLQPRNEGYYTVPSKC